MRSKYWGVSRIGKDIRGQALTEYVILLVLVAVGSIALVETLGNTVRQRIKRSTDTINSRVNITEEGRN